MQVVLRGINHGYIEKCKNNYDITVGGKYAGGIIGYNKSSGKIKKCGSSGNVTCLENAGGVCGFVEGNSSFISIEQCFNMGSIKANLYVGGISGNALGEKINISYLYNTGEIIELSGNGLNGGIIGANNSNVFLINSYNIGNIDSLLPNQIATKEVNVKESFYINGKMNVSNMGMGIEEYLFKELETNNNSIVSLLSENASGIWSMKNGYNDNYPILMWQLY